MRIDESDACRGRFPACSKSHCKRAQPAALLAIPDDETVVVLHPAWRKGYRLHVRGIADVNQFHVLMLDVISRDEANDFPLAPLPGRFAAACREADPIIPAGVPMTAELPFQFFRPGALQSDGSLPESFRGNDHWLWGWEPMAALPRVDGERIVLLGEPAFNDLGCGTKRFPRDGCGSEPGGRPQPVPGGRLLEPVGGAAVASRREQEERMEFCQGCLKARGVPGR